MRVWFLAVLMLGCEPMNPSGNPLQPAAVATSIPELRPVAPKAPPITPEEQAVFSISSEELHRGPTSAGTPTATSETPPKDTPKPAPAEAAPTPTPTPATPDPAVAMRWPVRLVTTVPHATPPRAILGLPDGREVVVNPGSMVPDLGLVVIAIAPGSAELARIAPVGDHATIQSLTLQAQY